MQISPLMLLHYKFFPMVLVDQNPYYYAAAGGILLGIATSINYSLRGKVTGMSGIVYGIFALHKEDIHQKLSIIGGMLVVSGIFFDIFQYGTFNQFTPFGPADKITSQTSYVGFAFAGLLVGFGTKLSNGCTSGHGLCGVSRLSIRSIVAVCVFLITAFAISTLRYHQSLGPFSSQDLNPVFEYSHRVSANVAIIIGTILPILGGYTKSTLQKNQMTPKQIAKDQIITWLVGIIFGSGLLVAGMVRRSNITGFLSLGQQWNPSLLFVLGCGVIFNLIVFNYMIRVRKTSLLGHKLFNPQNKQLDWKLVAGAACFGFGWGIGGLCPGPAIMQLSIFTVPIHIIWLACLLIGMGIARKIQHYLQQKKQKQKPQIKNAITILEDTLKMKSHDHQQHHLSHHHQPHIVPPITVKREEVIQILPSVQTIQKKESRETAGESSIEIQS